MTLVSLAVRDLFTNNNKCLWFGYYKKWRVHPPSVATVATCKHCVHRQHRLLGNNATICCRVEKKIYLSRKRYKTMQHCGSFQTNLL